LHLLYSRFWHKFLFDQGYVPTSEPYAARRSHGMILAPDGKKMSKSLGNVINPDEVVKSYGADTLRLHEMFIGPYDQTVAWDQQGLVGTRRFLERVWTLVQHFVEAEINEDSDGNYAVHETHIQNAIHKAIKKVSTDLDRRDFNTAIAGLMEFLNELYKQKVKLPLSKDSTIWREAINTLLILLAPFTPHAAEEMWQDLGSTESIHLQSWPIADDKYLKEESVTIVVQVNGKVRANITMPSDVDEKTMIATAEKDEKISHYLNGKTVVKIITVPQKLVNFVIK
jgi:leucyl-tRNA synthetase